jgi:hypothetical protein
LSGPVIVFVVDGAEGAGISGSRAACTLSPLLSHEADPNAERLKTKIRV